jgi:PmbA protein
LQDQTQTETKKTNRAKPVDEPAKRLADALKKALAANGSVAGWTLRATETRSRELYMARQESEAERQIEGQRAVATIYTGTDAEMGSATVTLTPGEEKLAPDRVEAAVQIAASTSIASFPLPGPTELPAVSTVDAKLKEKPAQALQELRSQLLAAVKKESDIALASAEFFAHDDRERLENSGGLVADRSGTRVVAEVVLLGMDDSGGEAEKQALRTRRRVEDLEIDDWVRELSAHARDAARAEPGPDWQGTVILPANTLRNFFQPVIGQASAERAYRRDPSLELDQPVYRGEAIGELLRLGSDPTLAFGTMSNRCDPDGVAAKPVTLVEDGIFKQRWAELRFAHYLGIPPTGSFANLTIGTGTRYERDMRDEAGILEVVAFSWLNPNPVTGDLASEVRFGYLSQGMARTPIRGGLLTGNVFEALANCQFSREDRFVGDGRVPAAMRIENLRLVGK